MYKWNRRHKQGYSGLKLTARKIADYFPKSKYYVEPFAGFGRTAQYSKSDYIILNDKAVFATDYLKQNFPTAIITNTDFKQCIEEWDNEDTFFLIDPPWDKRFYDDRAVIDRSIGQYYKDIFNILPKIKGDWIVCSSVVSSIGNYCMKIGFNYTVVMSDKPQLFGTHARTLLVSNMSLVPKQVVVETSSSV